MTEEHNAMARDEGNPGVVKKGGKSRLERP
jgi:hypothetical protein